MRVVGFLQGSWGSYEFLRGSLGYYAGSGVLMWVVGFSCGFWKSYVGSRAGSGGLIRVVGVYVVLGDLVEDTEELLCAIASVEIFRPPKTPGYRGHFSHPAPRS